MDEDQIINNEKSTVDDLLTTQDWEVFINNQTIQKSIKYRSTLGSIMFSNTNEQNDAVLQDLATHRRPVDSILKQEIDNLNELKTEKKELKALGASNVESLLLLDIKDLPVRLAHKLTTNTNSYFKRLLITPHARLIKDIYQYPDEALPIPEEEENVLFNTVNQYITYLLEHPQNKDMVSMVRTLNSVYGLNTCIPQSASSVADSLNLSREYIRQKTITMKKILLQSTKVGKMLPLELFLSFKKNSYGNHLGFNIFYDLYKTGVADFEINIHKNLKTLNTLLELENYLHIDPRRSEPYTLYSLFNMPLKEETVQQQSIEEIYDLISSIPSPKS